MSQPAPSAAWNEVLSGWDELVPAAAWKIERQEAPIEDYIAFFPDQKSKVYEQLLYNLPVMLHCMDAMGRLTSVNKNWCDAFGYDRREIEGRLFPEFMPQESRSRLTKEIYPSYFRTGQCRNEEISIFRKDGTLANVLLSMHAYRGDKGRIDRSICIMQDVTARHIAETASKRSEQRFRGAFEAAAHGMALVIPSGRIMMANAAFDELIGRTSAEYETIAFDELLHDDDRRQFLLAVKRLIIGEISSFNAH